ncbi:MAG: MFS transporter, partial [Bacillota bacterium]|nr:MFS transporter [Bacillota bacterium]
MAAALASLSGPLLTDSAIPAYFALAMGVDAASALFIGRLYDRIGFPSPLAVPLLSTVLSFLAFSTDSGLVIAGVIAWGAVMGIHETVMRAGIADITPGGARGMAYAVFNTIYGLSWLLGSTLMGALYAKSVAR